MGVQSAAVVQIKLSVTAAGVRVVGSENMVGVIHTPFDLVVGIGEIAKLYFRPIVSDAALEPKSELLLASFKAKRIVCEIEHGIHE